ncbi:MAG: class I SAM-dependent methyltransferase, partial [bacterium]
VSGRDVLELGCGTGKNTIWLASKARELVAMDFSSGMLDAARRRIHAANTRFVQHDVRNTWPVADRSMDVVIGNLILEHVEDLAPVYAEAERVLRRGGQLFLCELHPYKQLAGSQARFADPDTGETVLVQSYQHSVSEYVNTGLARGFALRDLSEWPDADASPATPPRLISVLFEL